MYARRLYQDSQVIICSSLSAEAIVQLRLLSPQSFEDWQGFSPCRPYVGITACFVFSKRGLNSRSPQNPEKTQPQLFCADAYFDKKTLFTTPQPLYHWKAETLSFLHVLLVWGVKLTSLLTKMCQSVTSV